VCGIIERAGTFLSARRGPGRSNAGLWEFPGGKICSNETAEAALIREIREELGLEISVAAGLPPNRYSYPWITIELIPYICAIVCGEPVLREHAEIRWVTIQEAQALEWAPADVSVLKDYGTGLYGTRRRVPSRSASPGA
jgi:8-oxo-dGTP diphosphatase